MNRYTFYLVLALNLSSLSACTLLQLPTNFSSHWSLVKAREAAEQDFNSGRIQVMYGGTIVCSPLGLSSKELELVKHYPVNNLHCGCSMLPDERDQLEEKFAYGVEYNQTIVSLIRSRR